MMARFGQRVCGLLGGGLMALTVQAPAAIALSEDALLAKLSEVSVFVLSNGAGDYITTQADFPNDGLGTIDILQVFFNEADAKQVGAQLRQENAGFRQNGVVGITNLATVHRSASEARDVPLKIVLVPYAEELATAQELDPSFGTGVENTASLVPLFAIQNAAGEFLGLPFGRNRESVIGLFFSSRDALGVLDAVNEARPDWQAQVGVVSLGAFTSQMLNSDDQAFERVRFLQAADVVNSNQRFSE